MANQVTVLGLEGDTLRGVRLEAAGEDFARASAEAWPLAAQGTAEEGAPDGGEQAAAEEAPEAGTVVEEDKPLARAFRAAASRFRASRLLSLQYAGSYQPTKP